MISQSAWTAAAAAAEALDIRVIHVLLLFFHQCPKGDSATPCVWEARVFYEGAPPAIRMLSS